MSAVARRFLFVRETEGPNAGYWVSWFLRFTGNVEGESWCASFVSRVNEIGTKGKMTVKKTASTIAMLHDLTVQGRIVTTPQADDLYFFVNDAGMPHHVGIVTGVNPLTGIAGNTSQDGLSSNGDGVWEHQILVLPKHVVYARLPA